MQIVYIGGDHRGFKQKGWLQGQLTSVGFRVIDLGAEKYDKDDDYTDIAFKVGEETVRNKAAGILLCGSGVGVSIAVNKVKGARGALCTTVKQAYLARNDDNANILCLASDMESEDDNLAITLTFLQTIFSSEERHIRRINKIKSYED